MGLAGGRAVALTLGAGDRAVVQPPLSGTVPVTGSGAAALLNRLGLYNLVCLFCAVLTDKKAFPPSSRWPGKKGGLGLQIVFHSASLNRVTESCQALVALLYPLKFSNVYVPILPGSLLDYLGAPSPYIMGIHSRFVDRLGDLSSFFCPLFLR